jgi:hypothetical protein
MERLDRDDGDDWGHDARAPLVIWPATRRTRRTLFITKWGGLLGSVRGKVPDDVTIVTRFGIVSKPYADRVARECPSKRLHFVGDLDPLDLAVFVSLSSLLQPFGIAVQWLGVGGAWIDLCREHLAGRWTLDLVSIRMSAFETKQLALLEALPVDWSRILGDEAVALLRGGSKLELEGATNPAFYAKAMEVEIERLLFGVRGRGDRPSPQREKK